MSISIDLFKDRKLFDELGNFNADLYKLVSVYDWKGKKDITSPWFNPDVFRSYHLTTEKDMWDRSPITKNPKYNLYLYCANYLAVFLIDLLYKGKDVLIDDFGCGAGYFTWYLSKRGFNNWSLWEDFSQVEKELLDIVLTDCNVNYTLNDKKAKPDIANSVGYPWYKKEIPNVELFCLYPCDNLLKTIVPILLETGYVKLCEDKDYTQLAYCKKEKYNEFFKKIKPYA